MCHLLSKLSSQFPLFLLQTYECDCESQVLNPWNIDKLEKVEEKTGKNFNLLNKDFYI